MVTRLRAEIDLNLFSVRQHPDAILRQEAAREFGQNDFLSADGLSSFSGIPTMRRPLQWQLQAPALFLLGSVSVHGIRAIDLSGESSRHRSVFALGGYEALPHGHSWWRCAQYTGKCKSGARLAHLRRLCSNADCYRTQALHRRQLWGRAPRHCLRARLHDDRFVSFAVSLGQVPQARWSGENAHAAGSARQYSFCHPRDRRQSSRLVYPPSTRVRARRLLCHGPRLSRFREALQNQSRIRILRDPRQESYRVRTSLFHDSLQVHWRAQRPDHHVQRLLRSQRLSRQTPPDFLSRRRKQQTPRFLDQQLHVVRRYRRTALSLPLAGRTLFQMDQTASAHQGVLRHLGERVEDSNLDRHLGLCPGRDREKTPEPGRQPLQNSTDPERERFRENPDFRGSCRCR